MIRIPKRLINKLVRVTWQDAYAESGWSEDLDPDEMSEGIAPSFGILVDFSDKGLVLAATRTTDGVAGMVWKIPRAVILSVEECGEPE